MNKIKEKLCKREDLSPNICEGGEDYKERLIEIVIEETSKAKDEEFIKLLDEIKNKIYDRINELTENCYQKQKGICVICDTIEFELKNWINTIEEIKQRIKEE